MMIKIKKQLWEDFTVNSKEKYQAVSISRE